MRYALLMHYGEPAEGELSEEVAAEAMRAFDVYATALREAGVLLSADVLQPTVATTTAATGTAGSSLCCPRPPTTSPRPRTRSPTRSNGPYGPGRSRASPPTRRRGC